MKYVYLSTLLVALGFVLLLCGYLNGNTPQSRTEIIGGLIMIIIGCFGVALTWPEPPQARCIPPLRSSIL